MTKSACFKNFVKYASLNVLGMLGLSFYILADTFFVSKGLGANGLAALNLAIPIYSFIYGCSLMVGIGGATKFSIQKSQDDDKAANRTFTNVLYLMTFFAVVFVIIGNFFSDEIVIMFGADESVFDMTNTYLRVILSFAPAFLLNNIMQCFVRNDGAPHLSMFAMVAGSMSNVVLDWVFIFPCNMGMFGAAFATGLAPVISMLILSSHFIRRKNGFHPIKCSPSGKIFTGIILNGTSSLVTELSSGIVIIVFNMIILKLEGNVGVAAYGVIANLSVVIVSIYTGIAQGIQPIISRSYGLKDTDSIRHTLRYAVFTVMIFSVVIYTGIFFGADGIADIFNSEKNQVLQNIAVEGLKLYFTACMFVGFNIVMSMYFTSVERPLPAQLISILRGFIVIVPAAFLMSYIAKIKGVWCSYPLTEIIVAVVGIMLFLRKRMAENK